jgi:hypothetical protein
MESYQIQNVIEMLIISISSLSALWIVTRAWIGRRGRIGAPDLARLTESVDRLRETVEGMRVEVGDVGERLEFTERVLAQLADRGSGRPPLPPP